MPEQVEDPRARSIIALDLLDFELLCPRDHRAPNELIEQDNYRDHGGDAPKNRPCVACAGCGLQIRSEPGKTEVSRAEDKHLAGHEKEPASGNRHHGVPDQADCRIGKLHLDETLPPTEAVNLSCFAHLLRDALQRGIKTECHIPNLAGKDEQNRACFDSKLSAWK